MQNVETHSGQVFQSQTEKGIQVSLAFTGGPGCGVHTSSGAGRPDSSMLGLPDTQETVLAVRCHQVLSTQRRKIRENLGFLDLPSIVSFSSFRLLFTITPSLIV
jgi:hypothetical protein